MLEQLNALVVSCREKLENITAINEINNLKVEFLGKNGSLTVILRGIKDVSPDKKAEVGKAVNDIRNELENLIAEKEKILVKAEKEKALKNEVIDITIPSKESDIGSLHPLTIVREEILDIFTHMGFEVREGPEIETDYYSFQALNIPKDHPARDMQDTFYITENLLLRPHTSPCQIRTMEQVKPPIRMVNPGKVYRSDDDATHSPMFQQIEGLVVDKNITLCDLKTTLDLFVKKFFNEKTKTRFRPSYFPFTEPSVEVDVSCMGCGGKGCRICKGTGWIEVLGAGVVNPAVLINCGIDPEIYSGFAFGMGVDRLTMIKFGIPDMRILFENNLRFIKQFKFVKGGV